MYKYKSFSLSNNPLLFLLHREVLESLNGAVDRVVLTELDASVDSKKKNSRVGRFSFLYHMPFLNKHMHTRWRAHTASLNTHTRTHTHLHPHTSAPTCTLLLRIFSLRISLKDTTHSFSVFLPRLGSMMRDKLRL